MKNQGGGSFPQARRLLELPSARASFTARLGTLFGDDQKNDQQSEEPEQGESCDLN